MTFSRSLSQSLLLLALLASPCLVAQGGDPAAAHPHHVTYSSGSNGLPFALVNGQDSSINGDWHGSDLLRAYAHSHPGRYIAFLEGDRLHRLDAPAAVAEAERAYAPMLPLNERQKELSAEMKPLSAQQHDLGEQQSAARGNPAEQVRIGREQGRIGEQQGEIGRRQGDIGRQQGEVGRAFYDRVQQLLHACLQDHTCPTVQGS